MTVSLIKPTDQTIDYFRVKFTVFGMNPWSENVNPETFDFVKNSPVLHRAFTRGFDVCDRHDLRLVTTKHEVIYRND